MIIVLVCTCMFVWIVAILRRRAGATTTPTTPVATPEQRINDDPAQWPHAAVHGEWTALDDHQLTRLLTDSAS
jgi:hypothetical protein